MDFLDAHGARMRNADVDVFGREKFTETSATLAGERHDAHLALVRRGGGGVDSVIRASAAGTVLERKVNPGDPVVPITTFQEGTVLLTLADMGTLEFHGTVDEIDGVRTVRSPLRLGDTPATVRSRPPRLGEHDAELRAWLSG